MTLAGWKKVDTGRFDFRKAGSVRAALGSAASTVPKAPDDPQEWLRTMFPAYLSDDSGEPIPFAEHHTDLFEWVWSLEKGERPSPFVAIWSRGHAKSTLSEMAVVAMGAHKSRRYVLYVSGTQDQADDHVENIEAMLEGAAVESHYPTLAQRKLGKYGASKGWRRNRLRTASGLTVDAMGLDSAARGAKVDEDRPDLIVLDDIDGELDSPNTTQKKMKMLSRRLLPAGADDLAVLAVQNLVHETSVFAQLADGSAGILSDRVVSGPVPAIEGLDYKEEQGKATLTAGTATWAGMPFERCQEIVNDVGLEGFLPEYQHNVRDRGANAFSRKWFARYDPSDASYANKAIARYIAWDTASKDEEHNAYTACVVGELLPDWRLIIRYVDRDRVTFDELPDYAIREVGGLKPDLKFRMCIVEDASSGQDLIPVLRKTAPVGLRERVAGVTPKGKEISWNAAAFWCKRGCVLLPEPSEDAPWLRDFEAELFKVPNTKFKDQVDAFALLINYLEEEEGVMSTGYAARQQAIAA